MNSFNYRIFGLARFSDAGKEYLTIAIADIRTRATSSYRMTLTPITNKVDVMVFVSGKMNCDTENIYVLPYINFEKVGIRL